jgi:hypothetical protein
MNHLFPVQRNNFFLSRISSIITFRPRHCVQMRCWHSSKKINYVKAHIKKIFLNRVVRKKKIFRYELNRLALL